MKLIVNADDFGITQGCNAEIIRLYQEGRLTSCSLMTNMPAAREAAALWKQNPELSVGLHLCVTAGRPLSEVPGLVKADGTFDKSIWSEKKNCDLSQLRQELDAQYDRFIKLTGKKPEHLDSHHGIERIPGGRAIMEELSCRHDIPLRHFIDMDMTEDLPFEVPELLLGASGNAEAPDAKTLVSRLKAMNTDLAELGLHPGKADADLEALSGLTTGREADAASLRSEVFGEFLALPDTELISWRDVKRS